MKAVILAAGLGTRLRPLTDTMPKAMVDIAGHPLLWYHIQLLKHHGITDIWINLHWHPDKITDYFGDGSKFGVHLSYSYEKELLGTAGSLKNPLSDLASIIKQDKFLVIYGDNLTNFNLKKLISFHLQNNSFLTLGLYRSREPWTMGVVETTGQGMIKKIVEKPPKGEVTSNLVNAGIYVCEPEVINQIPDGFSDFGQHTIPLLLTMNKRLFGLETSDYVQDTGTWQRLEKARRDVSRLHFSWLKVNP